MHYINVLANVVLTPGNTQHFRETYAGQLTLLFTDYLECTHPVPS